jgi:hypothetical protein
MDQEPDASGRLYSALLGFLEATERGEPPDAGALAVNLADRPDLARELREFAKTHALVERLTAPLRQATRRLAAPRSSPQAAVTAAGVQR